MDRLRLGVCRNCHKTGAASRVLSDWMWRNLLIENILSVFYMEGAEWNRIC